MGKVSQMGKYKFGKTKILGLTDWNGLDSHRQTQKTGFSRERERQICGLSLKFVALLFTEIASNSLAKLWFHTRHTTQNVKDE